jgi:AAA15 family ATPase/GTPase
MDTKHLTYFRVENFKRFDSLEVNDIGQFNLIVGDNNVGKTSLLEALLFDDKDYSQHLSNLAFCLAVKGILQSNIANYDFFDFYAVQKTIGYKFAYNNSPVESLSVQKKIYSDIEDTYIKELQKFYLLGPNMPNGALNFAIEFDNGIGKDYGFTSQVPLNFQGNKTPFISSNIILDKNLAIFFSRISIDNKTLENLIKELSYFIPQIISIETNYALVPQQLVLAVREKDKNLLPLSQYGDGTIKLLRCLMELELSGNERLMIDEIDAGIHYSRLKEFLKKVLQSAKNKNVQIFATTHSKECMEYYKQALEELGLQDSGRIIRIADTKKGIKAYSMRFEEFDSALSVDSEIR